jgi:hypothetical protein
MMMMLTAMKMMMSYSLLAIQHITMMTSSQRKYSNLLLQLPALALALAVRSGLKLHVKLVMVMMITQQ